MSIIQMLKALRDKTNAPITLIKEALDKTTTLDAAEAYINENWKPRDRDCAVSKIFSYVHQGRIGVLLELKCGTDFVAKTEEFESLAKELMYQLVAGLPGEFEEQPWLKDESLTVQNLLDQVSRKTGESIKIGKKMRLTCAQ